MADTGDARFPGTDVPVSTSGVYTFHERNLPEGFPVGVDLRADGKGAIDVGMFGDTRLVTSSWRLHEDSPYVAVLPQKLDPRFSEASEPSPSAGGSEAQRLRGTPQVDPVPTGHIKSPPLEWKDGAVAADVLTLRLAAEKVREVSGAQVSLPEVAGGHAPALESLARVTYSAADLKVTATIDTGMLRWRSAAKESSFTDYRGHTKQSALLASGKVAMIDGLPVSSDVVQLPDGRELTLWFAAAPSGQRATRYGLVERASSLMAQYDNEHKVLAKRSIPATQVNWTDSMPEIVAANPTLLAQAEQTVRFAVDHTGARAAARTTMTMRGGHVTPTVTFGDKGPVMYWLSEVGGTVPFAVTQSTPDAWLEVGQRPDFNLEGRQPAQAPVDENVSGSSVEGSTVRDGQTDATQAGARPQRSRSGGRGLPPTAPALFDARKSLPTPFGNSGNPRSAAVGANARLVPLP